MLRFDGDQMMSRYHHGSDNQSESAVEDHVSLSSTVNQYIECNWNTTYPNVSRWSMSPRSPSTSRSAPCRDSRWSPRSRVCGVVLMESCRDDWLVPSRVTISSRASTITTTLLMIDSLTHSLIHTMSLHWDVTARHGDVTVTSIHHPEHILFLNARFTG